MSQDKKFLDALKVLGLPQGSSQEEIKQRYKSLIKVNHPDLTQDLNKKSICENLTKLINNAYDILKNYQGQDLGQGQDSQDNNSLNAYRDLFNKFSQHDLHFKIIGLWVWLYTQDTHNLNKTFSIKDLFSENGFIYKKSEKAFYNPMQENFKKTSFFKSKDFIEKSLKFKVYNVNSKDFSQNNNFKKIA